MFSIRIQNTWWTTSLRLSLSNDLTSCDISLLTVADFSLGAADSMEWLSSPAVTCGSSLMRDTAGLLVSDLAVDELSLLTAGFLAGMRWFGLPPTLVVAVAAVSLEELEQKIGLTSMFAFSVKILICQESKSCHHIFAVILM